MRVRPPSQRSQSQYNPVSGDTSMLFPAGGTSGPLPPSASPSDGGTPDFLGLPQLGGTGDQGAMGAMPSQVPGSAMPGSPVAGMPGGGTGDPMRQALMQILGSRVQSQGAPRPATPPLR